LRREVWEPFERCGRVLAHFGYLDFELEKVTDRGRWLADLRVDRPPAVGEAFATRIVRALDPIRAAALIAAIAADEDRDYGELEIGRRHSEPAGPVRRDRFRRIDRGMEAGSGGHAGN